MEEDKGERYNEDGRGICQVEHIRANDQVVPNLDDILGPYYLERSRPPSSWIDSLGIGGLRFAFPY